jgi:hypothetical protein
MPETHVIRLRGPWDYEALARTMLAADGTHHATRDALPPPGRVHLPCDWGSTLGTDFRGRVRYVRRFGLPTNLDAEDQVSLVIDGVDYFGTAELNGTPLGELVGYRRPAVFEVRQLLAPRNTLVLEVELPAYESAAAVPERPGRGSLPGGPIGEVRLEIRSIGRD